MVEYKIGDKLERKSFDKDWFYLGIRKDGETVFMEDFSWDCSWYWSGGYLEIPNRRYTDIKEHYHFSGLNAYKNQNIKDAFDEHFKSTPLTEHEVWRLCDLMNQFYALQKCAEVFQYGGHMTNEGRNPKEINKEMAKKINEHIEKVIIPEVRKIFYKKVIKGDEK